MVRKLKCEPWEEKSQGDGGNSSVDMQLSGFKTRAIKAATSTSSGSRQNKAIDAAPLNTTK